MPIIQWKNKVKQALYSPKKGDSILSKGISAIRGLEKALAAGNDEISKEEQKKD